MPRGLWGIAQVRISIGPAAGSLPLPRTTLVPCCAFLSLGDNPDVPGEAEKSLSSLKLTEGRAVVVLTLRADFNLQLREIRDHRLGELAEGPAVRGTAEMEYTCNLCLLCPSVSVLLFFPAI